MVSLKKIAFIKFFLIGLAPLLSIVIFFLSYYSEIWGEPESYSASIPSLAFAILGYLLVDRIATQLDFVEINASYKNVTELLRVKLDVVHFGSQNEAMDYIYSRLTSDLVQEVCNTSINIEDEEKSAELNLYTKNNYNRTYDKAMNMCKGGHLVWKDVGGYSSKERLRTMWTKSGGPSGNNHYSVRFVLNVPQINFIILKYKSGVAEVLFNWDHRNSNYPPVVLLSRDPKIVEMFAVQHNLLYKHDSSLDIDTL